MTFSLTMKRSDSSSCEPTKRTRVGRRKNPRPLGPPAWVITKSTRRPRVFPAFVKLSSGEVMHSVTAPSDEANKLYVEQSCLASRLVKQEPPADELVIWDVGLGAASNAMAVVHCFERCYAEESGSALRPLRLVSFEWDLDSLTLAAKDPGRFPHLRHGAPLQILENGKWKHASSLLQWELLKGDFRDFIESAIIPDLIFYDPFSSKTDPALWTSAIFSRIFKRLPPKISRTLHLLGFDCGASCSSDRRIFCRGRRRHRA